MKNPFSNLEFHRSGIGLLSDPHEPDPGSAVHLEKVAGSQRPLTFCSCSAGRRGRCPCLKELETQIKEFREVYGKRTWGEIFGASRWHQLAQLLADSHSVPYADLRVTQGEEGLLRLFAEELEVLRYLDQSPSTIRFLERIGKAPENASLLDRAALIDRLSTFLRSPEEQHLNKAGMQTNRQSFEQSLLCRLAYHCFREFGDEGEFGLQIDLRSGEPYLTFSAPDPAGEIALVLQLQVSREKLTELTEFLAGEGVRVPKALPAQKIEETGPSTEIVGADRYGVDLLAAKGVEALTEDEEYAAFRYGELVLEPRLGTLIGPATAEPGYDELDLLDLTPSIVDTFESEAPILDGSADLVLDNPMSDLGIYTEFDYIELTPEDDEYDDDVAGESVTVRYGFGDEEVELSDLLRAKKSGQPYYQTDSGWIDLNSPALRSLGRLLKRDELAEALKVPGGQAVRLSPAELLRLRASSAKPIRVEGPSDRSAFLQRFLDLRPAEPLVLPTGLKSNLRPYQKLGLEWLKFLFENGLAGLLCDDMGLGKTHQAMALMVLVREQFGVKEPMLVVAPRTVISHWRNKLREHAPDLEAVQYHGPQRNLERALADGDTILTSYGVLRNDTKRFSELKWGLAIFDEVQQIKNRNTQGYQAAAALDARMKLGLTGTPIENALTELKSLFDLILPGYLGSEEDFRDRYGSNLEADAESWHFSGLRRLTAPFVLRRIKTAVLDELPEKIEDVRTCSLSPEQTDLYRQAIATRGVALMKKLKTEGEALPYIHIFALLNMLKQICDHPALVLGAPEAYERHDSGKWDLYEELLEESLDSGQKVVVFSQYLGMIDIMERHLGRLGVPSVTLTGASRNRGDLVDRFNNDPDCRVFLGSLKAGGTGIDLVGGSVVIHYDRWWNAAREDQATDRLYRIGQKRAVQVFKLVTEDTLEERIAAIIDSKRRLMSSIVQEDDPKLNKIFSREELIDLLKEPG
ncbi:MAG: DEAD/DEAH box helicase [Acidobacteriota bacterium]